MRADLTPEERAEWRRLCDAATPGPWRARPGLDDDEIELAPASVDGRSRPRVGQWASLATVQAKYNGTTKNAAFIVAARGALPRLLDALDAAEAEVGGLEAARIAYASELPPNADGDPDVGSVHQNIRALKAEVARLRERAESAEEMLERVTSGLDVVRLTTETAEAAHARGVAEERARVVAWLRAGAAADPRGWSGTVATLLACAGTIEAGDHEARTAAAKEGT